MPSHKHHVRTRSVERGGLLFSDGYAWDRRSCSVGGVHIGHVLSVTTWERGRRPVTSMSLEVFLPDGTSVYRIDDASYGDTPRILERLRVAAMEGVTDVTS